MLLHLVPEGVERPTVAVLTPGIFNSAYYEHSFLAHQMGVELVEDATSSSRTATKKTRTTRGFQRVDDLPPHR